MTIRETAKFFVFHFASFDLTTRDGNQTRRGPADVYISKDRFHAAALSYGWGAAHPSNAGDDGQTVGEQLFRAIEPDRICML